VLWHLGDAAGAVAKSEEGVALARKTSHPFSFAIALSYAAMLAAFARDADLAWQCAEQACAICEKHGFKYYRAFAEILAGWASCARGQVDGGLARLREGLESLKAMQAELRLPFYYGLLAEACGLAGRPDEALANVATGLAFASKNGEVWAVPELQRIHRELQRSQNALRTPSAPY
jgi:predicted ATPase